MAGTVIEYLQKYGDISFREKPLNDVEKDRLLDHMLLSQLLGELPERDRELIRMRYFQNKTQVEIAGILGISQVQVSRLEKKILREMREMAG